MINIEKERADFNIWFDKTYKIYQFSNNEIEWMFNAFLARAEKAEEENKWQPIETAPKDKNILVFYKNSNGKERIIKAVYTSKFTIEYHGDDCELADYSEEHDMYYCQEGWYECVDNWDCFSYIGLENENIPTYWMPLPEYPS